TETVTSENFDMSGIPESSEITDNIDSDTGNEIVDTLLDQVGKDYVWGGASPSGFDCSGIIHWAYHKHGKSIPRTASAQGEAGKPVSWKDIKAGDLVYTSTHIGVYTGDGRVIHAANPKRGVVVDNATSFQKQGFKVSRFSC